MAKKKNKKYKKHLSVFLYAIAALIVVCLAAEFFLFLNNPSSQAGIYVSSESLKQGDTVFIKVTSQAKNVVGNLGLQKLYFYKKPRPGAPFGSYPDEWISFLGIDADQAPGNYQINADTSNAEHFVKEIKVGLAGFSSSPVVLAPKTNQNKISNAKAVYNVIKNDNPILQKVLENATLQPYFSQPFSFPLGSMKIAGFSFGKFIAFGKDKLQHFGVDLQASKNSDIFAVNNGKVAATLDLSNYGKTVVIDHGLDIFSIYLHLDEFKVTKGEIVRQGQLIGLSGDTGYVTAPHLHFSMRVGGERVDPVEFINTTQNLNENSFMANIGAAFLKFFR